MVLLGTFAAGLALIALALSGRRWHSYFLLESAPQSRLEARGRVAGVSGCGSGAAKRLEL